MSKLKSLLEEARAGKSRIAELDGKIASLRAQLGTLEAQPINLAELDLSDESAVLALSSRELRLKALPAQIDATDRQKGDAMRALAATADAIRHEITAMASVEQKNTVGEISAVIERYCGSSALDFAWRMPIVLSIGDTIAIKGRPRDEGNQRREETEQVRDSFDHDTLLFADEAIAVADRYLERGTFISDFFLNKK
jgi:hypothetical protein